MPNPYWTEATGIMRRPSTSITSPKTAFQLAFPCISSNRLCRSSRNISTTSAIAGIRCRLQQAQARVDHRGALAGSQHHQLVDVELRNLRDLHRQLRQTFDALEQRLDIRRRAAAHAPQDLPGFDGLHHALRAELPDRRQPEGDVPEDLDVDSAEAEHQDRPELRIPVDAQDGLDAARSTENCRTSVRGRCTHSAYRVIAANARTASSGKP